MTCCEPADSSPSVSPSCSRASAIRWSPHSTTAISPPSTVPGWGTERIGSETTRRRTSPCCTSSTSCPRSSKSRPTCCASFYGDTTGASNCRASWTTAWFTCSREEEHSNPGPLTPSCRIETPSSRSCRNAGRSFSTASPETRATAREMRAEGRTLRPKIPQTSPSITTTFASISTTCSSKGCCPPCLTKRAMPFAANGQRSASEPIPRPTGYAASGA